MTGWVGFRADLRACVGGSVLALCGAQAAQAQQTAPDQHSTFLVRAIQVVDNTLLAPKDVERIVYPFMGPNRSADDIEAARAALQKAYEAAGYVTVAVVIPEQSVDSGIIRLEVQPQRVGKLAVTGTKAPEKVLAKIPSLSPGQVPNFNNVQSDIVALNTAPNQRVTPDVVPGQAPGTLDVTLAVEKSSAFHASAEINNYNSAQTSDLRVSSTLRYDNLWGRGDSLSVSAQTAPRRTNDGTVVSANYLARLGPVQALAYFVHSDSDIAVIGGTSVVGRGNLAGARVIIPLGQTKTFYQSLTAGIDYKDFQENVRLGADQSSAPIRYAPATVGWRGDWTGDNVRSHIAVSTTFGIRGLGDNAVAFDTKRYKASPSFYYVRGDASTEVTAFGGMQFYARMTGQYSDAPLVSNEQFSLGGMDTVRGYFESEALGDFGGAAQFEVRSPKLFDKFKPVDELRLLTFVDMGISGIHHPLAGQAPYTRLLSTGIGLRTKFFKYLNASLDGGVPVLNGPDTKRGDLFARFRIWGEF